MKHEEKAKCQQLHAHAIKAQKSLRRQGIIQIQTQKLIYKLKPSQIQHSTSWFWGWLLDHSLILSSFFPAMGEVLKSCPYSSLQQKAMGKPQRGFIHCRRDHRGRSWGQPVTNKTFEKVTKTRKFMKSSFCLTGNWAGFSTRYLSPKLPPSLETLSMGHPSSQDGHKYGRGVFQQQGRENLPVLMGKERLPTHFHTQFCKAVTF